MENLQNELLLTISDRLGIQGDSLLKKNIYAEINNDQISQIHELNRHYSRAHVNTSASLHEDISSESGLPKEFSILPTLKYLFLIVLIVSLLLLGASFLSSYFNNNLLLSILIEIGIIAAAVLIIYTIKFLIYSTYKRVENKLESIKIKEKQADIEFDDSVYKVIANTYETLSTFRSERERQAKTSYNAAITLVIIGILIIFFGVYLLFRNIIVSGILTSGIGGISNIIGGTILKFYRDTNNRMDALNNDLFILNSSKVQYALILKITNENERNQELQKLIQSIGSIKRP